MASMASGQQAGSSRERSDVADLEKQLVPLISMNNIDRLIIQMLY